MSNMAWLVVVTSFRKSNWCYSSQSDGHPKRLSLLWTTQLQRTKNESVSSVAMTGVFAPSAWSLDGDRHGWSREEGTSGGKFPLGNTWIPIMKTRRRRSKGCIDSGASAASTMWPVKWGYMQHIPPQTTSSGNGSKIDSDFRGGYNGRRNSCCQFDCCRWWA